MATGKKVLEWKGHEGKVTYVAFGTDGRTALTGGEDGEVLVWSLRPVR